MAGVTNHAQIGINETPITSALEKGDFSTAENLIRENTEPGYLDEGAFEAIPLSLVLSSAAELREFPRHLRLARLLVESGANPNLRIPHVEWQASPSPMENLWELYKLAIDQLSGSRTNGSELDDLVDPLFTIGLHDETQLTLHQLLDQVLELLDVFLACGGDPNVTTTMANSTLYHIVMADLDLQKEVVMKLHEAGGDLDRRNVHGTTALMDLVTYSHGDQALDILNLIWQRKPQVLSLHDVNCSNESALWRAMFAGSPSVARELLHRGASPSDRAFVTTTACARKKPWDRPENLNMSSFGVSAILAPLLQDSAPYVRHMAACTASGVSDANEKPQPFHVSLLEKVISCSISPVVDCTAASDCFPPKVLDEIQVLCTHETAFPFNSLLTLAMRPQDVALLMFGKLSAGLQQLCVNRILEYVFFTQNPRTSRNLINRLKQVESDVESPLDDDCQELDSVMALNASCIQRLVTLLKLPPSLVPRFEIAAARLQLGATLYTFESSVCVQGCDADSDETSWDPFMDDDFEDDIYNDDDDFDEEDFGSDEFAFSSEMIEEEEIEEEENEQESDADEWKTDEEWKIDEDNNSDEMEQVDKSDKSSVSEVEVEVDSGESVPSDICREEYEAFSREASDDTASSDDAMCD